MRIGILVFFVDCIVSIFSFEKKKKRLGTKCLGDGINYERKIN
jgi:hypothetical protein